MRIFSYVQKRYEDGSFTGVPRFDQEIRKVFPDIISMSVASSNVRDLDPKEDVVITDNHLALDISSNVRTIVVHHGCAQTHWDRDPEWRTPETAEIVRLQALMFSDPNRWFVAPSAWAAQQFAKIHQGHRSVVIPHWVAPFGPARAVPKGRPVVIGDWRNWNKGSHIIPKLRLRLKDVELRPLAFNPEGREAFYKDADLYLCLSASEGAPYAVADAEACRLRIVTTDVGFVSEIGGMTVFPWQKREDADVAAYHVRAALKRQRQTNSYFERYPFSEYAGRWRSLVDRVRGIDGEAVRPYVVKAESGAVAVELTQGIGNAVFALPLMKALKELGHSVVACVDTDAPTEGLWRRCRYVDKVVTAAEPIPEVKHSLSGHWCSARFKPTLRAKWEDETHYHKPEWELLLSLASQLGWKGSRPDVSDWHVDACETLEKTFDFGIIPGCKPGPLWARKRYPGMAAVSRDLVGRSFKVAVFGRESDRGGEEFAGEDLVGRFDLDELPSALAKCHVIVGTDSGPAHLAASLGIPTVMIFTATSPVKGDPVGLRVVKLQRPLECSPCQSTFRWKRCKDWICQELPVAEVVARAVALLEER